MPSTEEPHIVVAPPSVPPTMEIDSGLWGAIQTLILSARNAVRNPEPRRIETLSRALDSYDATRNYVDPTRRVR